MPKSAGLPPGTLVMLILRVLRQESLHGYAIAQKIRHLSSDQLSVVSVLCILCDHATCNL